MSRFCWLFSAHVKAEPDSVTRKPNAGFATTLDQGAGVYWFSSSVMTYSRPSWENPPIPLKNASLPVWGGPEEESGAGGEVETNAGGRISADGMRSIWSASVPFDPTRTARAAASRETLSSGRIWSARRRKIPPDLSTTRGEEAARIPWSWSWTGCD